jgi:hypothetical protein
VPEAEAQAEALALRESVAPGEALPAQLPVLWLLGLLPPLPLTVPVLQGAGVAEPQGVAEREGVMEVETQPEREGEGSET